MTDLGKPKPSAPWQQVLRYANARPTAATWREFLLGQPLAPPTPDAMTFGLKSVEELDPILEDFRALLARLISFPTVRKAEFSDVLPLINARAQGRLRDWMWLRGTGKVFPRLEPQDLSFERTLYTQLAVALSAEPFTHFKQCKQCGRFFYAPRRRRARLCSAACRRADTKVRALTYRKMHPEEYREYQRQLMEKRREEGKT